MLAKGDGMRTLKRLLLTSLVAMPMILGGCGDDPLDGENDSFPQGKADGAIEEGSADAKAVLALVNDPSVSRDELDDDAALHATAAKNIINKRNGADGTAGTADDFEFTTLAELDDVRYVGTHALGALLDYAIAKGYRNLAPEQSLSVVFSPQPYEQSHNVKIAAAIDNAQTSLDIAMYSYSDARIGDAIERAVARGIKVRFIFETAGEDRKLAGSALENSKSGRLERIGVNVRYINKIMHHKFVIIDGPRDDVDRAKSATVISGSGNWSGGAATRYDENTVFATGYPELNLRMQREFNLLWEHSRDFVGDPSLPYELSSLVIDDSTITDNPDTHAVFTSNNFTVNDTTFSVTGANTVSDALVDAIGRADRSIHIASGHLRSRPVSEALVAKRAARPDMDIKVYLDGQEYISSWYHNAQKIELDACIAGASTESQRRKCLDRGYYFGYEIDLAGIDVRYKYYSYRWHFSYAIQMHNKYMIIDGNELWTGSYNLSDNAEHNTVENMMVFKDDSFAPIVAAYEANFAKLWETGRAEGLLAELTNEVENGAVVPLVFDSMALSWNEITSLKELISDNCDQINSDAFRSEPEKHWTCPR